MWQFVLFLPFVLRGKEILAPPFANSNRKAVEFPSRREACAGRSIRQETEQTLNFINFSQSTIWEQVGEDFRSRHIAIKAETGAKRVQNLLFDFRDDT